MAPKSMKDRELHLRCEWGECQVIVEDTMDNFINHIKCHIQEFLPRAGERADPNDYMCLWKECGYSYAGSPIDLIRHLYFHAYHTKLKWFGLQEATRCKLNACQLDMQNRNLVPDLPEKFQCAWHQCMYHVDNPEYFYRHVEMHAMTADPEMLADCTEGLMCQWEGCRISVKNKFRLREHLRSHTQERRYGCSVCGGLFYNRTKFVDHLDRQLAIELQKFQCSHCFKTFSTERLLRDHMRCHVNHYKCPFCDMTCPSPSSLKAHIKFRHSEDKPHKCDLCDYSCKTAFDLRRHLNSHNAAVILRCEEVGCSYETKVMQSLRLHYKKVHNHEQLPRYLCHMCDSQFSRGGVLTKHLKKKHKFKWPSGHSRFRYKLHSDGFHRLQTVRYESIELTEQLINERQAGNGNRQEETPVVMETEQEMEGNQETDAVQNDEHHAGGDFSAVNLLERVHEQQDQRDDVDSESEMESYCSGETSPDFDQRSVVDDSNEQQANYNGADVINGTEPFLHSNREILVQPGISHSVALPDMQHSAQNANRLSVIVYHQSQNATVQSVEHGVQSSAQNSGVQHAGFAMEYDSRREQIQDEGLGLIEPSDIQQTANNMLLQYNFTRDSGMQSSYSQHGHTDTLADQYMVEEDHSYVSVHRQGQTTNDDNATADDDTHTDDKSDEVGCDSRGISASLTGGCIASGTMETTEDGSPQMYDHSSDRAEICADGTTLGESVSKDRYLQNSSDRTDSSDETYGSQQSNTELLTMLANTAEQLGSRLN